MFLGGEKVAQLVGEPGEEAPERRRRKFVQVDGHDAPGALHGKLHKKAAVRGSRRTAPRRPDPERDGRQGEQGRGNDCPPPAEPLGKELKKIPPTSPRCCR